MTKTQIINYLAKKAGIKERLAQKGTDNVAAYDAFLKGYTIISLHPEDSARLLFPLRKPSSGSEFGRLMRSWLHSTGMLR